MVLTIVDRQAKFEGKILEAVFENGVRRRYVLLFDCATPNRVRLWSAFTDEEVEEFAKFPDVHPCPPGCY